MKEELEEYMNYDIGSYCKDDWPLAQKLMINGSDPLPRRRCLTRASKLYLKPYAINKSLWKLPDGRNVRWANYQCRNFECLAAKNLNEVIPNAPTFRIIDVLEVKPGEIRIGLDFGISTGTFAAK